MILIDFSSSFSYEHYQKILGLKNVVKGKSGPGKGKCWLPFKYVGIRESKEPEVMGILEALCLFSSSFHHK